MLEAVSESLTGASTINYFCIYNSHSALYDLNRRLSQWLVSEKFTIVLNCSDCQIKKVNCNQLSIRYLHIICWLWHPVCFSLNWLFLYPIKKEK